MSHTPIPWTVAEPRPGDGGGERTLDQVVKLVGRSKERIRQVLARAVERLRKALSPELLT